MTAAKFVPKKEPVLIGKIKRASVSAVIYMPFSASAPRFLFLGEQEAATGTGVFGRCQSTPTVQRRHEVHLEDQLARRFGAKISVKFMKEADTF